MSEMKDFDVLNAPLSGVHLVEANAGTGKTWNIEALVIRLLIEKRLEPSQVLVVTFTDAAAQELRERVLERINQVYIALSDPDYSGSDVFLEACRVKFRSQADVLEHLENCKSRFDEASIYTIHSFCKQVLTDFRFEAGLDTDMQIMPDSRVIQQEVIKDEWRTLNHRFSKDPESRLADILTGKVSLSQLESSFGTYSAITGIKLEVDPESLLRQAKENIRSSWGKLDPSKWTHDYCKVLEDAIQTWDDQQNEIRRQWMDTEISRHNFAKDGETWVAALTSFLDNPLSKQPNNHLLKFTATFIEEKELKKNSSAVKPNHPFFQLIDFLYYAKSVLENLLLRESCERMKRAYLQKRQQQQVLIFDDLLAFTERALDPVENGENASALASALREKYPAALIDEFQDTDQTQYSIFRRVYVDKKRDGLLLYMIGDPKQSIYLFRGADLKTYFKARKDAESTFTLSRNFRSTQALIQGINAVFTGNCSFLDDELSYKPSTAHKMSSTVNIGHESGTPLRFVDVVARSDNKAPRELAVMKWTVSSISKLLSEKGARSTIVDSKSDSVRMIHPGDIAILVSNHHQSRRLKNMLADVGIPAVESGDSSVFLSEEAGYLNLVLDVILNPRRTRKVRALLTTPFFGLTSDQVISLELDESRWTDLIETFRTCELIASQKGILAGLRYVFDALHIEKTLVNRGNGERSLTNVRHLVELLHTEEESQRRSLSGLASWLLMQRSDANALKSDERSMRLESDDERVHILTMHKSKGLQFPIVYAPFLWAQAWRKKTEIFYDVNPESGDYERIYDPNNLVHSDAGIEQSCVESLQDRIRLLYVTLTRAEQRCYVPFSSGKDFEFSPLYLVLVNRLVKDGVQSADLGNAIVKSDNTVFEVPSDWNLGNLTGHVLSDLLDTKSDCIHFELCDLVEKPEFFSKKTQTNTIKAREFDPSRAQYLNPGRIVSSYSSIQRKYGHESTFDSMQRDEHAEQETDSSELAIPQVDSTQLTGAQKAILGFPKGANTGNFWHEVLETIDFSDSSEWKHTVDKISALFGFSDPVDIETVLELTKNTVESPIGQHPRLSELHPGMQNLKLSTLTRPRTLREMEFLYPYSATELQSLITELRKESNQHENTSALSNVIETESTNLLTGLIDLVFESAGKYFILDYKSNYLGDTLQHYSNTEIEKDIWINGYNLQYHLYTAALIKYLSKQINGFSYDNHFGGVFYLYWRGLNKIDTTGVFFDKPDWKVIEPLVATLSAETNISVNADIEKISNNGLEGGQI